MEKSNKLENGQKLEGNRQETNLDFSQLKNMYESIFQEFGKLLLQNDPSGTSAQLVAKNLLQILEGQEHEDPSTNTQLPSTNVVDTPHVASGQTSRQDPYRPQSLLGQGFSFGQPNDSYQSQKSQSRELSTGYPQIPLRPQISQDQSVQTEYRPDNYQPQTLQGLGPPNHKQGSYRPQTHPEKDISITDPSQLLDLLQGNLSPGTKKHLRPGPDQPKQPPSNSILPVKNLQDRYQTQNSLYDGSPTEYNLQALMSYLQGPYQQKTRPGTEVTTGFSHEFSQLQPYPAQIHPQPGSYHSKILKGNKGRAEHLQGPYQPKNQLGEEATTRISQSPSQPQLPLGQSSSGSQKKLQADPYEPKTQKDHGVINTQTLDMYQSKKYPGLGVPSRYPYGSYQLQTPSSKIPHEPQKLTPEGPYQPQALIYPRGLPTYPQDPYQSQTTSTEQVISDPEQSSPPEYRQRLHQPHHPPGQGQRTNSRYPKGCYPQESFQKRPNSKSAHTTSSIGRIVAHEPTAIPSDQYVRSSTVANRGLTLSPEISQNRDYYHSLQTVPPSLGYSHSIRLPNRDQSILSESSQSSGSSTRSTLLVPFPSIRSQVRNPNSPPPSQLVFPGQYINTRSLTGLSPSQYGNNGAKKPPDRTDVNKQHEPTVYDKLELEVVKSLNDIDDQVHFILNKLHSK